MNSFFGHELDSLAIFEKILQSTLCDDCCDDQKKQTILQYRPLGISEASYRFLGRCVFIEIGPKVGVAHWSVTSVLFP
jgi:hypothetical protein